MNVYPLSHVTRRHVRRLPAPDAPTSDQVPPNLRAGEIFDWVESQDPHLIDQ